MTNNLKIMCIPEDTLLLLITGKARIIDLPQGAIFFRANYNFTQRSFEILIECPDFPPVEAGVVPPQFFAMVQMVE